MQSALTRQKKNGRGRRYVSVQKILFDWLLDEVHHGGGILTRDDFDAWASHNLGLVWATEEETPIRFGPVNTCYMQTDQTSVVAGALKIFLRVQHGSQEGRTQLESLLRHDRVANTFMLLGLVGNCASSSNGIKKGNRCVVVLVGGDLFNPVIVDANTFASLSLPDVTNVSLGSVNSIAIATSTVNVRLIPLSLSAKPLLLGRNVQPKEGTARKRGGWMDREEDTDSDFSCDPQTDEEASEYVWERQSFPVGTSVSDCIPALLPGETRVQGSNAGIAGPKGQRQSVLRETRKRLCRAIAQNATKPASKAPAGTTGTKKTGPFSSAALAPKDEKSVEGGGVSQGTGLDARGGTGCGSSASVAGRVVDAPHGRSISNPADLLDPVTRELMAGMSVFSSNTRGFELAQIALAAVRSLRPYPGQFQAFLDMAGLKEATTVKGHKAVDKTRAYSHAEAELRKMLKTITADREEKGGVGGKALDEGGGDCAIQGFLEKFQYLKNECEHGALYQDLFLFCCKTLHDPLLILWFMIGVSEESQKSPLNFPERALKVMRGVIRDVRLSLMYPEDYLSSGGNFDCITGKFAPFEYTEGYKEACTDGLKTTYIKKLSMYHDGGLSLGCARYLAWCDLTDHPDYHTAFVPAFSRLPGVVAWNTRDPSLKPDPRALAIYQYEGVVIKEEPHSP